MPNFFDGRRYENIRYRGYLNQLPALAKGTTNWTDYIGARLRLREPLVFEHVQQQFGIDIPQQFSTQLRKMADLGVLDVSEDDFMIAHQGFWYWMRCWDTFSRVWWFIYF